MIFIFLLLLYLCVCVHSVSLFRTRFKLNFSFHFSYFHWKRLLSEYINCALNLLFLFCFCLGILFKIFFHWRVSYFFYRISSVSFASIYIYIYILIHFRFMAKTTHSFYWVLFFPLYSTLVVRFGCFYYVHSDSRFGLSVPFFSIQF